MASVEIEARKNGARLASALEPKAATNQQALEEMGSERVSLSAYRTWRIPFSLEMLVRNGNLITV